MSLRNKLNAPLSPVPSRPGKPPTVSAEYIEAIHVLNEKTLNQACDWLLDDTNLDAQKLLDVYHKCNNAFEVIQQQQPAATASPASMPGVPNLSASNLARGNMRVPLPSLSSIAKKATSTKGNVPVMRRTSMTKPARARADSDADLQASKKPRVSPPTSENPMAPPQSALNFLAKLNKDGGGGPGAKPAQSPNPPQRTYPSRSSRR